MIGLIDLSLLLVLFTVVGILVLGWWLTGPVWVGWRWFIRNTLAVVLFVLLAPPSLMKILYDWLSVWLPLAASVSQAAGVDWAIHFLLFAVLGALLFCFRKDVPVLTMMLGLMVFGALTEGLQLLVEGRQAAFGDWMADCVGVLVGYFLILAVAKRSSTENGMPSKR